MGTENQYDPGATIAPIIQVIPEAAKSRNSADIAQRGAQQIQQGLGYQSTDPDYVANPENWSAFDHKQIYKMVDEIDTAEMHNQAQAWEEIAAALGGGLFGMNISIQKELSDGAQGKIVTAAEEAAKKFVQQATDVQDVITAVCARINAAAYGAAAAKLAVPVPGQQSADSSVTALIPGFAAAAPGAVLANGKDTAELDHLAQEAMSNNYDVTYYPAGQGVPTFLPVEGPGDGGVNNPNDGGPDSNSDPNMLGAPSGNQQQPGNDSDKPGSDQSQLTEPASTSPAAQSGQSGSQNSTSPSNSVPGSDTRPGADSTTAAGYTGGPGGSRFGSSGGPGGTSGNQIGAGRSIPGKPGGVNPAAAGAFGGRPGQAGIGGMPGMGGLGGARKTEDPEREHKTPDYLVMDREEELLGIRDRTVPEAIGSEVPAAQFRPEDRRR